MTHGQVLPNVARDAAGWAPAGYECVVNLIRTHPRLTGWNRTRLAASLHGEASQVRESRRRGSVRVHWLGGHRERAGQKRQGQS